MACMHILCRYEGGHGWSHPKHYASNYSYVKPVWHPPHLSIPQLCAVTLAGNAVSALNKRMCVSKYSTYTYLRSYVTAQQNKMRSNTNTVLRKTFTLT